MVTPIDFEAATDRDGLEVKVKDNHKLLNRAFIGAMSGMGTVIIVLLTRGLW